MGIIGKKILIAEDDSGSRKLLALVLNRAGYDVVEATRGTEALDLVTATLPDLIIVDLELPGVSGEGVIQRVKAEPAISHIPMIVFTFHDRDSEIVQRALVAGATKVLYKPLSPNVIEDEVRHILFPPSTGV